MPTHEKANVEPTSKRLPVHRTTAARASELPRQTVHHRIATGKIAADKRVRILRAKFTGFVGGGAMLIDNTGKMTLLTWEQVQRLSAEHSNKTLTDDAEPKIGTGIKAGQPQAESPPR